MMATENRKSPEEFTFVIIGGGIAGVTCTEWISHYAPDELTLLISFSPLVKTATDVKQLTPMLEEFEVTEKPSESLLIDRPNLRVVTTAAIKLDSENHVIYTSNNEKICYKKLCVATGGKPKIIAENNPRVIGIRDTETVQLFQEKLLDAKRVVIVGNGGIATELVYEIESCEVIWVIKDASISATFFDPGAAEFFLPQMTSDKSTPEGPVKRHKYTVSKTESAESGIPVPGSALGPDWASGLQMKGTIGGSHNIQVQYQCEIRAILSPEEFQQKELVLNSPKPDNKIEVIWPIYVELTNGKIFGCDFVVSATGVSPNTDGILAGNSFDVAEDGGLKVDNKMQTNISDIYAAGDVATPVWAAAKHWFQMRLWSQARQAGAYCAKCMFADLNADDIVMDFCFELFTHVTKFFGYKVILLGLFNGQKLGKEYEILLRVTKGQEYVKVVMQNGRMQGAILVGETDLEEVFENLILNQMDLSRYGTDLLNPDVDIEDYFD